MRTELETNWANIAVCSRVLLCANALSAHTTSVFVAQFVGDVRHTGVRLIVTTAVIVDVAFVADARAAFATSVS